MRIQINDKEVIFPSSLREFTLGQRVAFQLQYGDELDMMLKSILEMKDDMERELELIQYRAELMYRTFAFFAGTTLEAIKESKFVDEIANIYHSCLSVLFDEEEQLEQLREFTWNNETWILAVPELKHGDTLSFGEFVDAKQVVKNMIDLGKGKWGYMLHLCAIYLRRKGEAYQEEFLYEDSDRLKLMESLPMDIAMQVGFFLSSSLNMFMNTSKYFERAEQSQQAGTRKRTMKPTAG